MIRMTREEYLQMVQQEAIKKKKPPKYRNRKVYVYADGFVSGEKTVGSGHGKVIETYDSEKEYKRWKELQLLERGGRISGLKRQVPFLLYPEFTGGDGKKHKAVYYKADAVYTEDGKQIVEDVKAYSEDKKRFLTTETFNLKWKILQSQYQDMVFRLF